MAQTWILRASRKSFQVGKKENILPVAENALAEPLNLDSPNGGEQFCRNRQQFFALIASIPHFSNPGRN